MSALVAGRASALPTLRKGANARHSAYVTRVPASHARPRPFSGVPKATATASPNVIDLTHLEEADGFESVARADPKIDAGLADVPDFYSLIEAEAVPEEAESLDEAEAPVDLADFDESAYDDSEASLSKLQAEIEQLEAEEEALLEELEAVAYDDVDDEAEEQEETGEEDEDGEKVVDWDGEPLDDDDLGLSDSKAVIAAEMDQDILTAMALAKKIVGNLDIDSIAELDLADAEASNVFDKVLLEGNVNPVLLSTIAGTDVPVVEEIEDVQGPGGTRKYDEEEETGMSLEEQEVVETYKLSRDELADVVPKDWDTMNLDWDDNNADDDNIALPEYRLVFIWQEKNLAVAVDQVFAKGQTSPLTEYFFWPRKDAWDDLRAALEARPFISNQDRSLLLNRLTEVINMWQDEMARRSVAEARTAFPDCVFISA